MLDTNNFTVADGGSNVKVRSLRIPSRDYTRVERWECWYWVSITSNGTKLIFNTAAWAPITVNIHKWNILYCFGLSVKPIKALSKLSYSKYRLNCVLFSFQQGRVDVRAQLFKTQTRKQGAQRRTRVQIVDNSKFASAQTYREPEFVISYRKRKFYFFFLLCSNQLSFYVLSALFTVSLRNFNNNY